MIIDHEVAFLNVLARRHRAASGLSAEDRLTVLRLECEAIEQRLAAEAEKRSFWLNNRSSLLELGRTAPKGSGRSTFLHAGCVATLLQTIEGSDKTRDEILHAVHDRRYSYRHAGFLLGQMCGDDPAQNLWFKDEDRRYHLHRPALAGDLKLAA